VKGRATYIRVGLVLPPNLHVWSGVLRADFCLDQLSELHPNHKHSIVSCLICLLSSSLTGNFSEKKKKKELACLVMSELLVRLDRIGHLVDEIVLHDGRVELGSRLGALDLGSVLWAENGSDPWGDVDLYWSVGDGRPARIDPNQTGEAGGSRR
jgi:hypothetical protein